MIEMYRTDVIYNFLIYLYCYLFHSCLSLTNYTLCATFVPYLIILIDTVLNKVRNKLLFSHRHFPEIIKHTMLTISYCKKYTDLKEKGYDKFPAVLQRTSKSRSKPFFQQ